MIILENILKLIFSIGLGYLFGSFLPGYFLPLWFKKVDIRKLGDGNPGGIECKKIGRIISSHNYCFVRCF